MKAYKLILAAIGTGLAIAGCASDNTSSLPAAYGTDSLPPPCTVDCLPGQTGQTNGGTGTNPTVTGFQGATGTLTVTGTDANSQMQTLDNMFFNSMPQYASDVRLTINLSDQNESVIVSYFDQNGNLVEAAFGVVQPYNPGVVNSGYNGWVNQNGVQMWKGFFQDAFGAIVIVVDNSTSYGDANPGTGWGGSIWFQNFDRSPPNDPDQGSNAVCWDITAGPYDCRSFLSGGHVVMNSSHYPTTKGYDATWNYQELGTFTGIDQTASGLN